jgi:hypothetical protein
MSDDRAGPRTPKGPGRGEGRDRGKGGPRRGGHGKGGFGKGPAKPARVETYESLKELTRGAGFRIDKYVLAEKGTHRPVRTEYRLEREGLPETQVFSRLADAQAAATAPLPEPPPIEEVSPPTEDATASADEAPASDEAEPTAEAPAEEATAVEDSEPAA